MAIAATREGADPRQLPLTLEGNDLARLLASETLLMRCAVMLAEWRRRYTDASPAPLWLPPGRHTALESDVAAFLADPCATFGPYPATPIPGEQ